MAKRASKLGHPKSTGNPPGVETLFALAKRVTQATGSPIVGGVAVLLHGGGRHTRDIDIFASDMWATHEKLEASGMMWDAKHREHSVDGTPVHMVSAEVLGGEPERVSTIQGIKVISLADLVRAKLTVGLEHIGRSKDIGHVIDLIERVPLDTSFAAKLPTHLRKPFKTLVDQVHEPRRSPMPVRAFYTRYAS